MSTTHRLDTNAPGDFYVNTACINCDTCRQLAPRTFTEIGNYSAVSAQPDSPDERRRAFHALLACPTAAIGSDDKEGLADAMNDFPQQLADGVYYCGYTSRKSFGGSSYLIVHPDGNWLIDSPRYLKDVADKIAALGGIRYVLLTHRDDVADADKYAAHFGAKRIIHQFEQSAQPDAEHFIEGDAPLDWHPDFRLIPTPGHTKGHVVLLYKGEFLFTGDHLAKDEESDDLVAHRDYCWYSYAEQTRSMERLAEESFQWILPGHGRRIHLPAAEMKQAMQQLVSRMKVGQ